MCNTGMSQQPPRNAPPHLVVPRRQNKHRQPRRNLPPPGGPPAKARSGGGTPIGPPQTPQHHPARPRPLRIHQHRQPPPPHRLPPEAQHPSRKLAHPPNRPRPPTTTHPTTRQNISDRPHNINSRPGLPKPPGLCTECAPRLQATVVPGSSVGSVAPAGSVRGRLRSGKFWSKAALSAAPMSIEIDNT